MIVCRCRRLSEWEVLSTVPRSRAREQVVYGRVFRPSLHHVALAPMCAHRRSRGAVSSTRANACQNYRCSAMAREMCCAEQMHVLGLRPALHCPFASDGSEGSHVYRCQVKTGTSQEGNLYCWVNVDFFRFAFSSLSRTGPRRRKAGGVLCQKARPARRTGPGVVVMTSPMLQNRNSMPRGFGTTGPV
jgi:hypothetical protein